MACGSCKTCVARCSNHPVSCGHAPSQRPSPMISQKLSEPLHNLPMKPEPALADLHRIPDATLGLVHGDWQDEVEEDWPPPELEWRFLRLRAETAIALQIGLATGEFRAGQYSRGEGYNAWKRYEAQKP